MSKAIRVHEVGGAEVMKFETVEVPPPGQGEVQLRHTAIGVNFIDIYHRTGLYPLPRPFTPGQEGAGVVTALGEGVTSLQVGQRVAYAGLAGSYAEVRNAKAERLVVLPEGISETLAASVMLKGMTAEMLLRRCRPVGAGDTVLIHAAAGGVGLLATQWARQLGATVIGAVGTPSKVPLAKPSCHHVISLADGPWVEKVKALTGGRGVNVVYDSVGKDTVMQSLDALVPRGMLVSFGQSSGKPPPLEIISLGGMRSLFLTRPTLHAYVATREELELCAAALFEVIGSGAVHVKAPRTFPLSEAQEAHRALEGRQTSGSVVLIPG
ncbi:MAG: quinone oxidoreductase [Archangium sp.]|nr:quinone oxidoreductase [Archangium sp.]MDP3155961.1 quinone oxidoreductase [Archangium sp.]MDP3576143.1 quinone oxidoreductase [Archangium sp.]